MRNSRYTIHSVSVQQVEPSYGNPRKRLSHSSKVQPSTGTPGVAVPLRRRVASAGFFAGFRIGGSR